MQLHDRINKLIGDILADFAGTPAQRQAAQQEIEVAIAPNDFGGWSIYPANPAAEALFAGAGPAGNFPTARAAEIRAERDNCWRVCATGWRGDIMADEVGRGGCDASAA
jgi:hypothetical protein